MTLEQGTYVQKAETVIKKPKSEKDQRGKEIGLITTTQIRNLLAMTADIYNEVRLLQGDKLTEDICGRIQYLNLSPFMNYKQVCTTTTGCTLNCNTWRHYDCRITITEISHLCCSEGNG